MTIQACNLSGRVPCPVYVKWPDGTSFPETDPQEIERIIAARRPDGSAIVEAKANRHGRVISLRMLCNEAAALEEIARVRALEAAKEIERPGAVITAASCTVYRLNLTTGHKVWQHLPRCGMRILLLPYWITHGRRKIVDPVYGSLSTLDSALAA